MRILSKGGIGVKALIVDDDRFVWMGLKNLIPWSDMNFNEVLWADNGETAYDIVMKTYPDLIITDVRMPVMNGIELCKKIYESNIIDIYIIMLSAYDEFEFARAAISYNVKDYILKPLDDSSITKLTEKIQVITNDLKNKNYYRNIRYNTELKSRILHSLYELNMQDIEDLFLNELPSMHLKGNDKKDCCLFLIELLFDYFQDVSCDNQEFYRKHRNEAVEYILNAKNYSNIIDYTYNLYMRILEKLLIMNQDNNIIALKIKQYIDANYTDPNISVNKIAEVFHIVPGYVGALFKKYNGVKLNTYLNKLRIEKACELLEDVSLKVNEVAKSVGIPDTNYFIKVFKKMKGISPSRYRMIYHQKIINSSIIAGVLDEA